MFEVWIGLEEQNDVGQFFVVGQGKIFCQLGYYYRFVGGEFWVWFVCFVEIVVIVGNIEIDEEDWVQLEMGMFWISVRLVFQGQLFLVQ